MEIKVLEVILFLVICKIIVTKKLLRLSIDSMDFKIETAQKLFIVKKWNQFYKHISWWREKKIYKKLCFLLARSRETWRWYWNGEKSRLCTTRYIVCEALAWVKWLRKNIKRVTHWAIRQKNQSDHIHWQFVCCGAAAERKNRRITTAAAFIWRHFYWKVILNGCLIALAGVCVKFEMNVFVVHLWCCCKFESFRLCWHRKLFLSFLSSDFFLLELISK